MRRFAWISIVILIILAGAGYLVFIKPSQDVAVVVVIPPAITPSNITVTEEKNINNGEPQIQPQQQPQTQKFMSLTVSSPSFPQNGTIPKLFTCDGKSISPELNFAGIPKGTQSLALTVEDPDVPPSVRADGMWNHWVVWNMPPTTKQITEGSVPPGVVGVNTSGRVAYVAPCPPDREHRYIFTLYAVDTMVSLSRGSTKEELLRVLTSHVIEKAELVGLYNRR